MAIRTSTNLLSLVNYHNEEAYKFGIGATKLVCAVLASAKVYDGMEIVNGIPRIAVSPDLLKAEREARQLEVDNPITADVASAAPFTFKSRKRGLSSKAKLEIAQRELAMARAALAEAQAE